MAFVMYWSVKWEYAVFVKSTASDTIDCGLPYDYAYGSNLSFNNDDLESLSLICLDPVGEEILIDSVSFAGGFEPGIPWQLRSDRESATQNDDSSSWCSDLETTGYTWSCTVGSDTNYGTPGAPSTCP